MPIGTTHKKMREVMSKFRYPTLAFSVLCAMTLSTPGSAQQAGTYTGTSSDGQSVSFTVGLDGNSVLAVTGAGISYEAPCKGGSAPTLSTAWGFGTDAVITAHRATMTAADPFFYIVADMKFSGSTVTGSITTRSPYLDPANTPPVRADYCISPKQAFSATLGGTGPDAPALPPGPMGHQQTPAQH
jgi:hypothetical protein